MSGCSFKPLFTNLFRMRKCFEFIRALNFSHNLIDISAVSFLHFLRYRLRWELNYQFLHLKIADVSEGHIYPINTQNFNWCQMSHIHVRCTKTFT